MLIIDGDYPMAVGALDVDRDLTRPIEEVRSAPKGRSGVRGWPDSETMASLPEMRRGGIAAALVKVSACVPKPAHPHGEYRTVEIAYSAAQGSSPTTAFWRPGERRGFCRAAGTLAPICGPV